MRVMIFASPTSRKTGKRIEKGDTMSEKLTNDKAKESVASWMALAHNQDELVTNRQFDAWLKAVKAEARKKGRSEGSPLGKGLGATNE